MIGQHIITQVGMYSAGLCHYHYATHQLLQRKDTKFEELYIESRGNLGMEIESCSDRTSVPQIFIGQHHVGGYDNLAALS